MCNYSYRSPSRISCHTWKNSMMLWDESWQSQYPRHSHHWELRESVVFVSFQQRFGGDMNQTTGHLDMLHLCVDCSHRLPKAYHLHSVQCQCCHRRRSYRLCLPIGHSHWYRSHRREKLFHSHFWRQADSIPNHPCSHPRSHIWTHSQILDLIEVVARDLIQSPKRQNAPKLFWWHIALTVMTIMSWVEGSKSFRWLTTGSKIDSIVTPSYSSHLI